jgi:hypothetical protein
MASASQEIARDTWRAYFDEFSRTIGTAEVTIEVAGLDVGDQIAAERLVLDGITYDDKDDIVIVAVNAPGSAREDYEHNVNGPQQIFFATLDDGATVFDVTDSEDRKHLISVRPAGALPPA